MPVFDERWRDDGPCVERDRPRQRSVAVAVESFDEYRRTFGGFEGPGRLPYAVAGFFEQGGRRAYITRIVHDYRDKLDDAKPDPKVTAAGVARGVVRGAGTDAAPLELLARNEGSWGNQLRAALEFVARPQIFEASDHNSVRVDSAVRLPAGTLLRLTLGNNTRTLRLVADIARERRPDRAGSSLRASFNQPITADIRSAEVVEGTLLIDDGDGRSERHDRLGFSELHPRWIATVLCYESELVFPAEPWSKGEMVPVSPDLLPAGWSDLFRGEDGQPVKDRYADILSSDFFDQKWVRGNEEAGDGIYALSQIPDLSLVVTPDLYSPAPLSPSESLITPVSLAGDEFQLCVDPPVADAMAEVENELEGLSLDPRIPGDLKIIVDLQKKVVDLADVLRSFIVLLDVPPGLNQRQILTWREQFDSAFAAAYYPWLQVARRDDLRNSIERVPPSAIAAGIVAKQELAFGVPHGPANVLAAQVIAVDDPVSPKRHDELHSRGINIYLKERDGVRLTAARTLSLDREFRQLSVRRLLTMIRRTLEQRMQWAVFEPNSHHLRSEVRLGLESYLRQLFRIGAFRGSTEDEAFFVRCDETNNPPFTVDAGRLVAEIGVAPSEPIEFIVLWMSREGDGTLTFTEEK
jgi:hypothetical protein